jgi:hypothetical protein
MGRHQGASAYLSLLSRRREAAAAQLVRGLLDDGMPLRAIYAEIFQASLDEAQRARAFAEITAARENFVMQATERIMSLFTADLLGKVVTEGSVVCGSFGRGRAYLQIKIAAALLMLEGYDVCQLAPDMPLEELDRVVDGSDPIAFVFWADTPKDLEMLVVAVERIRTGRLAAEPFIVVVGDICDARPLAWRRIGADACVSHPSDVVAAIGGHGSRFGEA